MYQPLFTRIDPDTTIITVNNRLARYLKAEYAKWHSGIFQSPHILPLNAWLTELWSADPRGILLNSHQAQLLWQSIIGESEVGSGLLRVDDTAKQVAQAWQLVQYWDLELEQLAQSDCDDVLAFVAWARAFESRCQLNEWVDSAQIPATFIERAPTVKQQIILAGFDNIPLIIKRLIDNLKAISKIEIYHPTSINQQVQRAEFQQAEQEIEQMLAWACVGLQTPDQTIACVVPDLLNQRSNIARVLQRKGMSSSEVNISAALPLSDYPMVQVALRILQFAFGDFRWQQYSALLRSPYIAGYSDEMDERALLDARLRDIGELIIPVSYAENFSSKCPAFQRILKQLPTVPQRLSIATWQQHFLKILSLFGWPGDREHDSIEYQTYQRLLHAFEEFRSLALVCKELDSDDALATLNRLLSVTAFQPKTTRARIQIIGLLEAGGLSYDQLWIQGLTDETLPAPLAPNPYLPVVLQRELGMPRSNPEHEWEYAQKMLHDCVNASNQVMLSYATHEGDRELCKSPLIEKYTAAEVNNNTTIDHKIATLERIKDDQAPPVSSEKIHGGSYLFKAQAMCPFKAFAEIRLKANTLSEPSQGLAASERGELIHEILDIVWRELGDSTALMNLDKDWLQQTINTVLTNWTRHRPITFSPEFFKIESRRLFGIIEQWLALEKERTPFKVIACEEQQTVTFNGIDLKLRVDRIDELPDGERIIIDYKTGHVSISNWTGERPNEPQLLLYCVTSPDTQGISFAQIKPNKMQFKGVTSVTNALPKVKAALDWDLQVSAWTERLLALSDEFLRGHAAVDPQFGAYTCQYCQLAPLCRIHTEEMNELNN